MPAYITVGFTPKNNDLLQDYSAKAAPTLLAFEGEFLVKAQPQPLNGEPHPDYQVIIAFPTRIQAEEWYASPQYQNLIELREQAMDANFQLIG